MRIDQSTHIAETASTERVTGATNQSTSTAKTGQAQPQSEVSLRHEELRAKLEETPDIRQDRVAALQQAMKDGTYRVSNQDLANAMFDVLVQKNRP